MFITWIFFGEKNWKLAYSNDSQEDARLRNAARKRLSWVLSTFNSGLLSVVGALYLNEYTRCFNNPINLITFPMHAAPEVWYSLTNVGYVTMIYFGIFNIAELVWGHFFFKEHLDPLTAMVHHPLFAFIMLTGLSGNALTILKPINAFLLTPILGSENPLVQFFVKSLLPATAVTPYNTFFLLVCLEEVPTFLLGLGTLFPALRTDAGFGITFFLFRLAMHAWFMWWMPKGFPFYCFILSLVMHIFWFKGWVQKYLPTMLGTAADKKKK